MNTGRKRLDKDKINAFLKTVFRFDIKIIHENDLPLFSYLSKYILDINTMQRHTIRGKTRTIIYPIIIYLGVTSIMGCKRLEIKPDKKKLGEAIRLLYPTTTVSGEIWNLPQSSFILQWRYSQKRRRLAKTKKRNKRTNG